MRFLVMAFIFSSPARAKWTLCMSGVFCSLAPAHHWLMLRLFFRAGRGRTKWSVHSAMVSADLQFLCPVAARDVMPSFGDMFSANTLQRTCSMLDSCKSPLIRLWEPCLSSHSTSDGPAQVMQSDYADRCFICQPDKSICSTTGDGK